MLADLSLQVDYDWIFPGVLDANGFQLLTPHLDDYKGLISLPRHHGDPFDRVMITQSLQRGLTIISQDPEFPAYGVSLLW